MLTDQYRYVVIAYLHLVLIGFISFAMMGWLIMRAHIRVEKMWHIALIIIGFATSEVLLALSPWFWGPWSQQLIFASSAVLVLGFGMVFFSNRAHPRQS
jgi:hypothetical protein